MKALVTVLFAICFGLMYAIDKDENGGHYASWSILFGIFTGSGLFQWVILLITQ